MLSGDQAEMAKYFNILRSESNGVWTLQLQPKGGMARVFSRVEVKGNRYIQKVLMEEKERRQNRARILRGQRSSRFPQCRRDEIFPMKPARHQIELFMAIVWSVLVVALCFHQVQFWRSNKLDSDVMALLPNTQHDALVTRANENMANAATRDVVILIGSEDAEAVKSAASVFDARIKETKGLLRAQTVSDADTQAALDFYARYRDRLLTTQQKQTLEQSSSDELLQASMQRLYGVGASSGLSSWISDPLALSTDWWQSRLGEGMTQEDGFVLTQAKDKTWVVLQYESELSAFQLDGVAHIQQLIESAGNDAKRLHPISKF